MRKAARRQMTTSKRFGAPTPAPIPVQVVVNISSHVAFILSEGWKAVSSTCKADSRAFKKAELPVCPLEAFRELVRHLLGEAPSMLCWRRKDPRVT